MRIEHIAAVEKRMCMDFEIITPNNGCDDEVNLNYMNAFENCGYSQKCVYNAYQMKVKFTQKRHSSWMHFENVI